MAAGFFAVNVGQWDMKLMSAKQHYSALNLDPAGGGVVPERIQLKLNELQARCKCHGKVTKKKPNWDGGAKTEVWKKDQGA